jgi:phage gp45-like
VRSRGRPSAATFARDTDPAARALGGLVRRMAVDLTSKALWRVLGFLLPDGRREGVQVEVFPGIGFYARPPAGGKPEAIVVNVGGAEHPVIVATRDEATRAAAVADVAADEAAIYNSESRLHLKADGTLEARTHAGAAVAVARQDELLALRNYVYNQFKATGGHTHVVSGLGTTTITASTGVVPGAPTTSPDTPVGTTKFKAE